jgi:hypothetical protein|tara:strand:+ start:672 stop:1025 length:354 start_codon:yes stop_codon:yes gene_type:complete
MATRCLTVAPVATKLCDIGELPLAYDRLYLKLTIGSSQMFDTQKEQEIINELDERKKRLDAMLWLEAPWMDIKRTARYSSTSISTLRRAVASGRLKTSKATGKLLFKKEWVDGWLNG